MPLQVSSRIRSVATFVNQNYRAIAVFQSLNLAWLPRADGVFLTDDPQKLVQQGQVSAIPIVSGEQWSTRYMLSTINFGLKATVMTKEPFSLLQV